MEMKNRLADLGLFSGLPEEECALLAQRGLIRDYEPGALIARRGDPVDALFSVMEGQVKLSRSSPDGREQTLYVFGPGEPFCLCGVFGEGAFLADAVAMVPSRVLILHRKEFEKAAARNPRLLSNIASLLSRRLGAAMELAESLSLREIPQRVATFLLHAPEENGEVRLGMTQRELAKLVGATPETLSRVLRRLSDEGLISASAGRIAILDPSGLRALADGDAAT